MSGISRLRSLVNLPFLDLSKEIPEDTVVANDVDNTMLLPKTHVGTGPCNFHVGNTFKSLEKANHAFTTDKFKEKLSVFILKNIKYETEKGVPEYVASLQDRNVSVLALTARPKIKCDMNIAELTDEQLSDLGIHLEKSRNPFYKEDAEDFYKSYKGIFFSGEHKGEYITNLCGLTGYKPRHFIFGDDLEDNAREVDVAMKNLEIPCHAFEYTPYEGSGNGPYRPINLMAAAYQIDQLVRNHDLIEDWAAEKMVPPLPNDDRAACEKYFEDSKNYLKTILLGLDKANKL